MTEPSSGHAPPTTDSLTSRATGGDPDPQKPRPKSRTADVEPLISNADNEDALICMQTQKQVKAVQLLNGGAYIELDTLANYAEPSEVQALMRAGPIYNLGPERRGFSWSRPNSRHNDDYLISLSLYRRNQTAESWVYSTTEEMANHARKLGVDHAYVWSLDPDDKNAPGHWDYVRTNTHRHVLIPYEQRAKTALETLRDILELGPPDEDGALPDYSLEYYRPEPLPGTLLLLDIGREYDHSVCLIIHHSGDIEAAFPTVQEPGTDPRNYRAIPLTSDEQVTLAARVEDSYPPD